MNDTGAMRALVVGDDAAERHRVMAWFGDRWTAEDGGGPAAALDLLVGQRYGAVLYTAGTDSVDLATWFQALCMTGFRGLILDTRPGTGATSPAMGIGHADSRAELQTALTRAG